jgi:hypothetical protein
LRKCSVPEGTYLAGVYSLVSKIIFHLCFINSLNRVAGFRKGEVVVIIRQFDPNTPCCYLDVQSYSTSLSTLDQSAPQYNVQAFRPKPKEIGTIESIEIIPAIAIPIPPTAGPLNLDVIKDAFDRDTVKLEWHSDLDSIDPLGMEYEFREDGSLESQSFKDEEWKEEDLDWDINPKLTRKQRGFWIKMFRKHLKIFVGRIGKLEKGVDQTSQSKANKTSQSKRKSRAIKVPRKQSVGKISPPTSGHITWSRAKGVDDGVAIVP